MAISIILTTVLAVCVIMFIRNFLVYRLRRKIADRVFSGWDYEIKLKIYHRVTYDEMVYKIWRPVRMESFYTKEEIEIINSNQ